MFAPAENGNVETPATEVKHVRRREMWTLFQESNYCGNLCFSWTLAGRGREGTISSHSDWTNMFGMAKGPLHFVHLAHPEA